MLSQSSVNEFQEVISIFFCQRVSGGYLNLLSIGSKAKYPKESAPPMAATGLLGPDIVHCMCPLFQPTRLLSLIHGVPNAVREG